MFNFALKESAGSWETLLQFGMTPRLANLNKWLILVADSNGDAAVERSRDNGATNRELL